MLGFISFFDFFVKLCFIFLFALITLSYSEPACWWLGISWLDFVNKRASFSSLFLLSATETSRAISETLLLDLNLFPIWIFQLRTVIISLFEASFLKISSQRHNRTLVPCNRNVRSLWPIWLNLESRDAMLLLLFRLAQFLRIVNFLIAVIVIIWSFSMFVLD